MDRHRMVQLTGHGPGFMLGKHMTGHESIQHYVSGSLYMMNLFFLINYFLFFKKKTRISIIYN